MTKRLWPIFLGVAFLLFAAAPAWAHKVNVFAYVEGETVFTESYFSGGKAVHQGRIQVFDSSRNLLLEGRTDENGRFEFPIPKLDDLTIAIEAGMGHKGSFRLRKSVLNE